MDTPETGNNTIDSAFYVIGMVYFALSVAATLLPRESPLGRVLAIFAADLRNVLASKEKELEVPDLMPRTARHRSRSP